MSRIIKFRGMIKGKNDEVDQWVYGYLNRSKKNSWMEVAEEDGYLYFIQHSNIVSTQVKLETVGQFTGLLDKNGKEIYEEDLVKVTYSDGSGYDNPVEVYFENGSFWCGMGYLNNIKIIEVIGNIYENPELLGGKK